MGCLQKNLDCLFWGARAGTDVGHISPCRLILSGIEPQAAEGYSLAEILSPTP